MTQRCSKCGLEKPIEQFPRRRDLASGHSTICLACGRAYRREHYANNRPYYLAKARRRRGTDIVRVYGLLLVYLRSHPCVDCGETDIRVLQFDHIDPATKTGNISRLVRSGSWARVLIEIAKCEVRCGNCHRRRTLQQRHDGEIREDPASYAA